MEKVIFETDTAKCIASFDGELINLMYEIFGEGQTELSIYEDELDKLVEFVKSNKR
jgi:hypothetical protein